MSKIREFILTKELKASIDMNEYEMAGKIIEMAHKAFGALY